MNKVNSNNKFLYKNDIFKIHIPKNHVCLTILIDAIIIQKKIVYKFLC